MKALRNFAYGILPVFILSVLFSTQVFGELAAKVPGTVVAHSPSNSKKYIGSPSLIILPNGDYLASHDFFGPAVNRTQTAIYKSTDKGKSWYKLTELKDQFWSNFFIVNNILYLIGTTKEYGSVVIRKSADWGKTWTTPVDEKSGVLFDDGEYHTAPVPVVVSGGRIWRSMEDRNPPTDWGRYFRSFVISAPVDSDLLNAGNWEATNRLRYRKYWPGSAWLEGNVVETPQGLLWNILRNQTKNGGKAAVIKIGLTGKVVTFDPNDGFIDFPGGSVKFTIRYDSVSRKYLSLTNYIQRDYKNGNPERTRNTLALISSEDLIHWKVDKIILFNPDVKHVGFQYADWRIEGDDMIFVSRTAFPDEIGQPPSQHDSNYLTFHRIENFRKYLAE